MFLAQHHLGGSVALMVFLFSIPLPGVGGGASPSQQLREIHAGSPLHSEWASALEEEQIPISASALEATGCE